MAERVIRTQKEALKKANNARFEHGYYEYIIKYEGGIAEYIAIYGRKKNSGNYRFVSGFSGYKFHDTKQVIAYAKSVIQNKN